MWGTYRDISDMAPACVWVRCPIIGQFEKVFDMSYFARFLP